MIGIYKITNTLNDKCYIGQSIDIETRWAQHICEGKRNTQKGKLYPAMFQDGIENFTFEVIEECSLNQEILNERERHWIKFYNSFEDGYNSTIGGQGEDSWTYDPDLIRQLWDEGFSSKEIQEIVGCGKSTVNNRLRGYSDYNATTSHSRGALRAIKEGKMSHLHIGDFYNFSEAQKSFFVKPTVPIYQYTLMGEYVTSYPSISAAGRAFIGNKPGCEGNISHCLNDNYTQRTAFGFQWSKEKVDRMPPCPVPHGRLVRCINTQEIFPSTTSAAKAYKIKSHTNISECCMRKRHSAGKHPETGEKLHWEYVE